MPLTAISRNGIAIRLTEERWQHIVEEHAEVAPIQIGSYEGRRRTNTRICWSSRRIAWREGGWSWENLLSSCIVSWKAMDS